MAKFLREASGWFWNDDFWLPPNVTWKTIEVSDEGPIKYANFKDLGYPLMLAWVVLLMKFVFEKRLFRMLGVALFGLKERKRSLPPPNPVLEEHFRRSSNGRLDREAISSLVKKVDMTERQVELWMRQRILFGRATKLDKFCESAWKAMYYTFMYVYAWVILWDKKWFWSITDCWYRYPHHSMTGDVWAYYMVELSFYWSLLISQFFDVQRLDFWAMFCHHVATILLLSLSWTCNLFKVGTLVLWVHDAADVFLESAKMFKYGGIEKLSDVLFYGFAICWMVTRLGYFPTWILYSITVEAGQFIQYFHAYHIFSLLLSILLILNLYWAYFIFKVAYLASMEGKIEKDLRSESEGESD